VLSYPESTHQPISGLTGILNQQSIYSEIDETHRPIIIVRAAAPIRSTRGLTGVATIDLEFNEETGLAHDLDRLALSLLGFTVLVITVLIYWLFRNIIYKPIEKLLDAMLRLEAGDFN